MDKKVKNKILDKFIDLYIEKNNYKQENHKKAKTELNEIEEKINEILASNTKNSKKISFYDFLYCKLSSFFYGGK